MEYSCNENRFKSFKIINTDFYYWLIVGRLGYNHLNIREGEGFMYPHFTHLTHFTKFTHLKVNSLIVLEDEKINR